MDGAGQMRALYKVLVWKPERMRSLRCLGEAGHNKLDLQAVGCNSVEWVYLAPDRVKRRAVSTMISLSVP